MAYPGLLLLCACVALFGCQPYASSYVAPADGRAHVVWSDDQPVFLGPSETTGECMMAIDSGDLAPPSHHAHYHGPGPIIIIAPVPVHPYAVHPASSHHGGGGLGGMGGMGKGKQDGRVLAVLAVAALAAMPFVALGLAVGNPEPGDDTAATIDRVNAYNDMSRSEGTPCSAPPPPEAAPP